MNNLNNKIEFGYKSKSKAVQLKSLRLWFLIIITLIGLLLVQLAKADPIIDAISHG